MDSKKEKDSPLEWKISLPPNSPKFKAKVFPQIFLTFAVTLGAFGMGTMEGYTSPGIPSMEESGAFGPLSSSTQGNIASLALLGATISGVPTGFLIDKIGRKITLMIVAIPFITGWILVAASTSLPMIYIGRGLTGFCSGAVSLAVPVYISEASGIKIRGRLSSMFQLMVTFGNVFAYAVGAYVDWKWLAITCTAFPLLSLFLMLWLPESPSFLLSKKKDDEARAALMWLRGADNPQQIDAEFSMMEANAALVNAEGGKMFDQLLKRESLKPMIICLLLFFFQQMTGIEGVLMYTVTIFREAGSNWDPNLCTVVVGVLQVVSTFISAVFVDKAGRRKLLLMSQLGSGGSMVGLAIFFIYKQIDPTIADRFGWFSLVSLGSFIVFFAVGIGPVPFLMVAELNSCQMVGLASAISTTVNWLFSYLVTYFMMYSYERFGGMQYCLLTFSVVSLVGVVFTWKWCPETKGKSVDEIQQHFQKAKHRSVPTISGTV